MKYPSEILDKCSKVSLGIEYGMSRCFNGNEFVYSFSFDDKIYISSLNGDDIKEKKVRSKYINDLKMPDNIPSDLSSALKIMCELPFYSNIIYDKYRHVYYRFVFPKTEVDSKDNLSDLWQCGRSQFSVMVLDKNFNILGETLLPRDHYRSNLFYITEKGLYISESHCNNPSLDEDLLKFRLFVF